MQDETLEKAKQIVELDRVISELQDEVDGLKEDRQELAEEVMEVFQERGINKLTINSQTLYLHSQYWAGYKNDKTSAVEALKEAGLSEYIKETYNTHSLSAYIRDLIREYENEQGEPLLDAEEVLPPALREEVKVTEKISLRNRSN